MSIDVLCKSMDWFLYDIGLCHEIFNTYPFSNCKFSLSIYVKSCTKCNIQLVNKVESKEDLAANYLNE